MTRQSVGYTPPGVPRCLEVLLTLLEAHTCIAVCLSAAAVTSLLEADAEREARARILRVQRQRAAVALLRAGAVPQ